MNLRVNWILIVLVALAGMGIALIPRGAEQRPPATLLGTTLDGRAAPAFRLADQFGHSVTLSQFRGHTVVLTFMESRCTGLCPIVAEAIHRVLIGLGPQRRNVAVLVISTDPEGDTPASVRGFSQQHGMLQRWHYLVANRKVLEGVWHAYFIYAAPKGSSPTADQQHTSATYLFDSRGRERVLLGGAFDTETLNQDIRLLSHLPLGQLRSSIPAPEVGHAAPSFSLAGLSGPPVSPWPLRGKVVLINFWATWCGPCKAEMPRLAGWYRRLRAQGFVVLGVDQLENAGTVRAFVQGLKIPYPVVLDQNGDAAAQYNVVGTPASYLIDRQGYIEDVRVGILDQKYLAAHIEPLLGAGNAR